MTLLNLADAPAQAGAVRIIRPDDVSGKLRLSKPKLFDMIARGQFPKPFTIVPGGRAVGWLEHEVDNWIMERSVGVGEAE